MEQTPSTDRSAQSKRMLDALLAFASEQKELARTFARRNGMHTTDSVAIVAIIRAEEQGDPLTPARLADTIGLSGGATSILLNRLEGVGYVARTRGHSDRRRVTLHSTAAVHDIADVFFAPLKRRFDAITSDYTLNELRTVEQAALDLRTTMVDYLAALERPEAAH